MCFFLPDHNNVLPGYKSPPEKKKNYIYIYVAVNFSSQLILVFLLLLSMVMYANEIETKEK